MMKKEEEKRSTKMRDEKIEISERKRKISILDLYFDEIKNQLDIGLSIAKVYKKINEKLPDRGISYNGFYRYCKRRGY